MLAVRKSNRSQLEPTKLITSILKKERKEIHLYFILLRSVEHNESFPVLIQYFKTSF